MPSVSKQLVEEVSAFIKAHSATAELVTETFRAVERRIDDLRVPSSVRRWHHYRKDPDTGLPIRDMGPLKRHLGLMERVAEEKKALDIYDTRALDMTHMRMEGMVARLRDIAAADSAPPLVGKSPFTGDGSVQHQAAEAAGKLEAMLTELKNSRLIERLQDINLSRNPELKERLMQHPPAKDGSWTKRVSGQVGWTREK